MGFVLLLLLAKRRFVVMFSRGGRLVLGLRRAAILSPCAPVVRPKPWRCPCRAPLAGTPRSAACRSAGSLSSNPPPLRRPARAPHRHALPAGSRPSLPRGVQVTGMARRSAVPCSTGRAGWKPGLPRAVARPRVVPTRGARPCGLPTTVLLTRKAVWGEPPRSGRARLASVPG